MPLNLFGCEALNWWKPQLILLPLLFDACFNRLRSHRPKVWQEKGFYQACTSALPPPRLGTQSYSDGHLVGTGAACQQ